MGRCAILPKLPIGHSLCYVNARETGAKFTVAIERVSLGLTVVPMNKKFRRQSGCQASAHERIIPTTSKTYERFLFDEFFADPRPDVILVFGNAHERMPLRQLVPLIDVFAGLVDRYIRPPTRLIWFSRFAEDVRRKPKRWRRMRYEYGNMTRLQWLDAANRIMYNRTRRRFVDSNSLLMFPDLLQMSEPILDDFNLDGVHMKGEWYLHVMSYILQSLCYTGA